MSEIGTNQALGDSAESVLREELVRGDKALGSVQPVLRYLLSCEEVSVFSDEVIARVRGMLDDLARQMLDEIARVQGHIDPQDHDEGAMAAFAENMAANSALLAHVHGLALEWQLTERLQQRLSLDPVLPPLVQALIASPEPSASGLAMNLLAAQARFCQAQRRMRLPLGELPGDLLHALLLVMRTLASHDAQADQTAAQAEAAIRSRFDEGQSRLGIISRLVTGMGGGAIAALSVGHGGTAVFLSALALASGQDRDTAILATSESQMARLALSLSAAGLKTSAVQEQFLSIHPDITLPQGLDRLDADRAAAMLASAAPMPGH